MMLMLSLGCTRNNGDIGPIFGRWVLESAVATGTKQPEWTGDLFWAFQNDVIQMSHTERGTGTDSEATYGHFRLVDDTLFIDFPDPLFPVNSLFLLPNEATLQVLELKSGRLVVEYNPTPDSAITYTFQRW